jgi:protein phosphatase
MGTNFTWRSCAETHRGVVRKVNEDSVLDWPEVGLWTVADGMGRA